MLKITLPIFSLANHFIFQAEILINKNVHLRTGFDYHRRQELKLEQLPGLSGFTFGLGFKFIQTPKYTNSELSNTLARL